MKISIVGTGYVGLVAGACLSQLGNNVISAAVNGKKIDNLKRGIIPVYEPGLESIGLENYRLGALRFTTGHYQSNYSNIGRCDSFCIEYRRNAAKQEGNL